jgi:hypothetical protein
MGFGKNGSAAPGEMRGIKAEQRRLQRFARQQDPAGLCGQIERAAQHEIFPRG